MYLGFGTHATGGCWCWECNKIHKPFDRIAGLIRAFRVSGGYWFKKILKNQNAIKPHPSGLETVSVRKQKDNLPDVGFLLLWSTSCLLLLEKKVLANWIDFRLIDLIIPFPCVSTHCIIFTCIYVKWSPKQFKAKIWVLLLLWAFIYVCNA